MHILALNCGSSSVKCAVIDAERRLRTTEILVQGIGSAEAALIIDGSRRKETIVDTSEAVRGVIKELQHRKGRTVRFDAVAHRIVHGGEEFVQPTLLDATVVKKLEALNELAPLHNPPALAAVAIAREVFSDLPQVAIFDTGFHATLASHVREYALQRELSRRLGLRRYGFHGTSHAHIAKAVAQSLGVEPQRLRIISCHLGNGASVAAIEYGRSVETSMGMTPIEGLVMGTRSGDIDPGVLLRLMTVGYDHAQLTTLLNNESGLKGLTGTNDLREIERRSDEGDEDCRIAISMYVHRILKYVGAYAAVMGGVDAIAFTGGVGENSQLIRSRVLDRCDFLGVFIDDDKNRLAGRTAIRDIATVDSRVRVFVVAADEEMSIACLAAELLEDRHGRTAD